MRNSITNLLSKFSLPVRTCSRADALSPGVGVGSGGDGGVCKMFKFLHFSVLSDGQGAGGRANLYEDRSSLFFVQNIFPYNTLMSTLFSRF